jgi:signal transduction histidine kinase
LIWLDLEYVRTSLLPALERRYLRAEDGFDYCLRVFASSERPFYSSTGPPAATRRPDATVSVFGLRFGEDTEDIVESAGARHPMRTRTFFTMRFGPERRVTPGAGASATIGGAVAFGPSPAGQWRMELWNRAGDLAEVVARTRGRNLLASFGILGLLATSTALLVTAARRADRAARDRMQFVAGVTHEVRTPLAVILSAAENLADGVVGGNPDVRAHGVLVRDQARRLRRLCEQALELAGAESRCPAVLRPIPLSRLVEDTLRDCGPGLRSAEVTAETSLEEPLPEVWGEEAALQRALGNLVDNAVKYAGQAGWVRVCAGVRKGRDGKHAFIAVEDGGPGIAREDLPHIFEPFYRGHQAVASRIHGSGLGLSLVRGIVLAHGGRMEVTSDPKHGSRFDMILPRIVYTTVPLATGDERTHPAG